MIFPQISSEFVPGYIFLVMGHKHPEFSRQEYHLLFHLRQENDVGQSCSMVREAGHRVLKTSMVLASLAGNVTGRDKRHP